VKRLNISLAIVFVALMSNALAQDATGRLSSVELTKLTLERRAVDAAIWGMPIVSFDVMRQGFFRDAKAHYGDIMYWSKFSTWRNQTTTPDTSSRYVIFFTNTKDGPVVVELPPAGDAALSGTLLDAWQVPLVDVGTTGEDLGNGGKYLLLPPRYQGKTPLGYIAVPSNTFNGIVALRVVPKTEQADDVREAIAYMKQLKTYPLAAAKSPPEQRYIDMATTLWDGIVRFDESFYTSLARMVNEELSQARDLEMLGLLRPLGIEKGKRFKPDTATRTILKQASREAQAQLMEGSVNYGHRFWPDRKWDIPVPPEVSETGFKWEAADYLDVDARGIGFFSFYAPPAKPGTSIFHLDTFLEAQGQPLRGENTYRLHVPANVPAKQFWTFTVYDHETSGFIRKSARVGLDSYDEQMKRNPDGSVDLYTGPRPPKGQETNWIPTVAGKGWFAFFRFYDPDEPLLEKTWKLPDIERLKCPTCAGNRTGRLRNGAQLD
jgi:hypothetical protein